MKKLLILLLLASCANRYPKSGVYTPTKNKAKYSAMRVSCKGKVGREACRQKAQDKTE